jgi:hypothetical protein
MGKLLEYDQDKKLKPIECKTGPKVLKQQAKIIEFSYSCIKIKAKTCEVHINI